MARSVSQCQGWAPALAELSSCKEGAGLQGSSWTLGAAERQLGFTMGEEVFLLRLVGVLFCGCLKLYRNMYSAEHRIRLQGSLVLLHTL